MSKEQLNPELVTAETHDEFFNKAVDYVQLNDPCVPKNRKYALAYYNDAHPAFGGGSRCLMWFESEKEMLESVPGLILVLNSGSCGLNDADDLSEKLALVLASHWNDEISQAEAVDVVNQLAKGFFQVEWWGTREQLLKGSEKFPSWLRSGWRQSEDASPLRPEELERFFDYLGSTYGA